MRLKSNLQAASIAEVVLSLTIISICFGIAMLSIVGSRERATGFQEINDQTRIQNHILTELLHTKSIELDFNSEFTDLLIEAKEDEDYIEKKYILKSNDGKTLLNKIISLRNERKD